MNPDDMPDLIEQLRHSVLKLGDDLLETIVERDNLRKMLDDSKAELAELRRQRDDARDARDAAIKKAESQPCTCATLGVWRCLASFEAHQKPVPMCKPDPLADLYPEGGRS